MKKQSVKKLGLLAMAMMLLTGCYNGWNHLSLSSSSSQPSSSESSSSEEPGPEPVVFDGVDLTYPFDGGDINEISETKFKQILEESLGDPNAYVSLCDTIHPYLMNYFLTHNHMTDEELKKTLPLFSTIAAMARNKSCSYLDMYNMVYYFASINTDHLVATFKEIWADKIARAYFVSLFEYNQMFGYASANDFFQGSDAEIREMARKEALLLEGTPELRASSIVAYYWFSMIETENIEVAFRFIRRLARVMVINLSEKEIGYLLANMTNTDLLDIEDIWEEISEHLLDFINRGGQALIMFNISSKSYEALYSVGLQFVENCINTYDGESPLDAKHQNRIRSFFDNFFRTLNPRGLKVMVNFVGQYGANFTEQCLDALRYEPDDIVGSEPVYECLIDLYNELYGLLEYQDKEDLRSAFNSFGLNLDLIADELEEACSNPDAHQAGDNVEEICKRLISEKIQNKFKMAEEDVRTSPDQDTLILKQGVEYTLSDFTKYLREFRQWTISYRDRDEWYHEVNRRDRNNIKLTGSFDTETTGMKFITFTVETSFASFGPESVKLTMPYYVVSGELDVLSPVVESEFYYKNMSVSDGVYAIENGHPIATAIRKTPTLLQNYSYSDEDCRVNFDIRRSFIYNTTYKMFVKSSGAGLPTNMYDVEIEPIQFSTLNTSNLGVNYVTTTMTVKNGEELLASIPVYFRYNVVADMPTFDHSTPETPVK